MVFLWSITFLASIIFSAAALYLEKYALLFASSICRTNIIVCGLIWFGFGLMQTQSCPSLQERYSPPSTPTISGASSQSYCSYSALSLAELRSNPGYSCSSSSCLSLLPSSTDYITDEERPLLTQHSASLTTFS